MRKFALLISVSSVLGVLFYVYLFFSETGRFPSPEKDLLYYILSLVLANGAGVLVFSVDRLLDSLIAWRNLFFSRFLSGFLFNSMIVSLLILGFGALILALDGSVTATHFYHQWKEEIWKLGILLLITFFLYEVFYGWFFSYRYYSITQVGQLRAERWQLELQFESLKSQISPHYLFNCLNTISSLLYKDSQIAEEFIRRMADTFRYVLNNQKQKLVTLREEVEFVKAYYYLLQVRYEHHLKLEINLPKNLLDTFIPPLCLQLLVENAVKHNQISKNEPLLVYISAQDNTYITVTSTKTSATNSVTSFRIGLENIRNRYQFFSPEKITIKDEDKFTVQLPVIKTIDSKVMAGKSVNYPAS
jgi:two-component system, LytTR family, sensor kinase